MAALPQSKIYTYQRYLLTLPESHNNARMKLLLNEKKKKKNE
jgi:hypothetical protein